VTCLLSSEIFSTFDLVEDGVEDTSSRDQGIELKSKNTQSIGSRYDTVVWTLVMRQFLFLCQVASELEPVLVRRVLQVIVRLTSEKLLQALSITRDQLIWPFLSLDSLALDHEAHRVIIIQILDLPG